MTLRGVSFVFSIKAGRKDSMEEANRIDRSQTSKTNYLLMF